MTEALESAARDGRDDRPVIEVSGEPVAVYRFYDRDGALLYVGITGNLASRFSQHAIDKWWWPLVVKRTVVLYDSREEALAEEGRAIVAEKAIHNVAGNGKTDPVLPDKRQVKALIRELKEPNSFSLDPSFLDLVDAFADKRQVSRQDAVGQLILGGLLKDWQLNRATLEDVEAEMADMATFHEARPTQAER